MRVAAAVLTVAGLAVLLFGTVKAAPVLSFSTPEERASMDTGRHLMLLATAILLGGALLAGSVARALVIASPGVAAVALVYAFPRTLLPWLPTVVLGIAALAAAVSALRR